MKTGLKNLQFLGYLSVKTAWANGH